LTATRTFTIHVAVPPSAYPLAFPEALASETIPLPTRMRLTPTPHRALAYPIGRASGQLLRSWGWFIVALRIALSAGVLRDATWIVGRNVQPFPMPVLDQADNPRRLVAHYDGSEVRLCSYPYATVLDGIPWWVQSYRLSGPPHRFDGQSPRWGLCITPASRGEESHLYLPQVIKTTVSTSHPRPLGRFERTDRSFPRAHGSPVLHGQDVTPGEYYDRMSPSVQVVLLPTWRLVPRPGQGASLFRYCLHLRASGDSLRRWPRRYSPLPLTSLRRVPVFSTMDSATSLRWWFAAIPYRSLRHPAWIEGTFRLTSISLPACTGKTHCRLPFPSSGKGIKRLPE
jgi:hypothetical protein